MKTCPDCKREKPLSEYYRAPKRHDGVTGYCKPCMVQRANGVRRNRPKRDPVEPTLELYVGEQLEGVFSSTKEIAIYMNMPKSSVTAILNGDYEAVESEYQHLAVHRVYSGEEFSVDIEEFGRKGA